MKKNFISAAIALSALLVSGTALAQKPADCQRTTCPEQSACQAAPCSGQSCPAPFAGLNLTQDQQTKLKALCDARKTEAQKNRKDKRAERQQCRKDYLAQIKSILTPEQYVQFLENSYLDGGKGPGFIRGDRKHHGRHHGNARGFDRKMHASASQQAPSAQK